MSIPLEIFFSYASEDEEYRKRLVKALRTLEREETHHRMARPKSFSWH